MEQETLITNFSLDQLLASDLFRSKVKELIREEMNSASNGKPDEFLTLPEAAAFLKKSRSTVYRLTSTRSIPFFKRNNSVYFDKSELAAWLRAGKKISVEDLQ